MCGFVYINTIKSGYKNAIALVRLVFPLTAMAQPFFFVFKEIWGNDASTPQATSNSHSALASVRLRMGISAILLINLPTKIKISFIRKDGFVLENFRAISHWSNKSQRCSNVYRFITFSGDNIL